MATRRKPMSEINIVPYIDVMLVLLVIFMVTAPLLTQGMLVELPKEASEPLERADDAPMIVSITKEGVIYLSLGGGDLADESNRTTRLGLQEQTTKVFAVRKDAPVFIRADETLEYGAVVDVMTILQEAGAESVGLITDPPET